MTRSTTLCSMSSIAAAVFGLTACAALADGPGHGHHGHLPQLQPATPATLPGSCEELAARAAGLPNTVITGSSTVAAGTLALAGQPVAEHCRVTGQDERARQPGGRQDLRHQLRDAPAQGLERPLLPPGQWRHRRQRGAPPPAASAAAR